MLLRRDKIMPRKKYQNSPAYRGGYIRPTRCKKPTFRAELYVHGKQERPTFKTRLEAESWIDEMTLAMGSRKSVMDAAQLMDANEALRLIPDGVSLTEAVRYWIAKNETPVVPGLMTDALARIRREKSALDRSVRTSEGYRDHVGKFIREQPGGEGLHVHEVTTAHVKTWMQSCGYKGKSWNGYRCTLHAFFAWCKSEGMTDSNPVAGIPVASVRKPIPECLPVEHVKAFIKALESTEPAMVPYFALGFFAGVRTAELARFGPECLPGDCIHIGAKQAKTGQQRFIAIAPNLAIWLESFPPAKGGIKLPNHRKRFEDVVVKVKKETPGFVWTRNAMRHSFASYHLAAFQNSTLTAHELGHQSPALLFNTYRTLAKSEDGKAYFDLRPTK